MAGRRGVAGEPGPEAMEMLVTGVSGHGVARVSEGRGDIGHRGAGGAGPGLPVRKNFG